ncbi:AraC family transcriptional regulator [Massilia sp. Root351]|uniref:AraC family transcriptional regulator n=1 Tax=Massilia sp. Root351 TaxID=1736522 RepID=UPI00070EAA06|nr:AraC family transcriptional regulator [Massilia sp. Root351]KQV87924.1 AraC family transcriptional regulator [Massilia sp. Root351]
MNSSHTSSSAARAELARVVGAIAQTDGEHANAISSLMFYRRSAVSDPVPCIYGLGLGMALQGGKRVTLGGEIYDYGPGQSLVTAMDLPVVSYVTRAASGEPYLGMWLGLDCGRLAQVAASMDLSAPLASASARALSVVDLDEGLTQALTRLVRLLDEPGLIKQLAPLIEQEIMVRLLSGAHGPALRQLVAAGSPSQQIARVIGWLKQHYTEDFPMDDLAAQAHMSPSTFRLHFRAVAGMSPLQYLKQLRLQDARQLMLNEDIDAGSAAVRVGYESASQFSREYTRLFGAPPLRDIRRLLESVETR